MALSPKDFIRVVLISEMEEIVKTRPYHAFLLIAVGIEFLGKCMLDKPAWDNRSDGALKRGIALLARTDPRYANVNLRELLRNGFVHVFRPKRGLTLQQEKNGFKNFDTDAEGQTVLVIEAVYRDFVTACNCVIEKPFPDGSKMNSPDFV